MFIWRAVILPLLHSGVHKYLYPFALSMCSYTQYTNKYTIYKMYTMYFSHNNIKQYLMDGNGSDVGIEVGRYSNMFIGNKV